MVQQADMLQFRDGPLAGRRFVAPEWPPAEEIKIEALLPSWEGPDGAYVRLNYSKLPPQDEDSPLIRGAEYEWREYA